MRKLAIIFYVLIHTALAQAQNNYVLLDVTDNSQMNKNAATLLDSANKIDLLNSVLKPVSGKFKTYRFIETYYGESPEYFPDSTVIVLLHDVLILVVDKKNRIIDGYQYSLEYSEYPSTCDLYRLHKPRRIKLDSNLKLSRLKFRLVNDCNYCGRDPFLRLSQSHLIN